jgi:hypothetical protein
MQPGSLFLFLLPFPSRFLYILKDFLFLFRLSLPFLLSFPFLYLLKQHLLHFHLHLLFPFPLPLSPALALHLWRKNGSTNKLT